VRNSLGAAVRGRLVEGVERGAGPLSFRCDVYRDTSVDLPTGMYAAGLLLPYVAPRQSVAPSQVDKPAQHFAKPLELPT